MSALAHPKRLFIIDGIGALVSAVLLGLVLTRLEDIIGMPRNILYFLAAVPCFFLAYDCYAYFRSAENWRPFLKGIGVANITYCFLSSFAILFHFSSLTYLGLAYFLVEILIVFAIGLYELKVSTR